MSSRPPTSADCPHLLVAGGGPVGLATAIDAAGRGLRVTVLEPRTGQVDKACGEGLMPSAVAALARLGVNPAGVPFAGISYLAADGARGARHAFSAGPGLGVRRTELHRALSERAHDVGVEVLPGRLSALTQDADGVEVFVDGGRRLRAPWLVGADGLHSTVRRLVGMPTRTDGRRYGLRRHAVATPWAGDVEVYWARSAEAYLTPVGPDTVGVALLTSDRTDFATTLAAFPALRERLAGVAWSSTSRGAGPLLQRVARRTAGRVLLVGDAAGYVDALTGEGLRIGLATSRAALDAVEAGDPALYERRWHELTRDYRWLTGLLVGATRHRPLRRLVVPASRALPRVFGAACDTLAG